VISEWASLPLTIRVREKAITSNNILVGWRASGLWPVSPVTVLARLSATSATTDKTPHTPPQQQDLDLLLLESSPPDGTELREVSAIFNSATKALHDLPSPVKCFSQYVTAAIRFNVSNRQIIHSIEELSLLNEES